MSCASEIGRGAHEDELCETFCVDFAANYVHHLTRYFMHDLLRCVRDYLSSVQYCRTILWFDKQGVCYGYNDNEAKVGTSQH